MPRTGSTSSASTASASMPRSRCTEPAASTYFTKTYENEWGEAINYDGDGSGGVREFVSENAAYWIDEFRLDGLRLDATQSMHGAGGEHVLHENVRERVGRGHQLRRRRLRRRARVRERECRVLDRRVPPRRPPPPRAPDHR